VAARHLWIGELLTAEPQRVAAEDRALLEEGLYLAAAEAAVGIRQQQNRDGLPTGAERVLGYRSLRFLSYAPDRVCPTILAFRSVVTLTAHPLMISGMDGSNKHAIS
jgi:hypothetical protein